MDKMDTTVRSGVMPEKIKACEPHIIVNKNLAEPYYSIMYYDTSDKKWHIGFGSYNLSFVRKWLQEEFEEVDVEFVEVKHGEWFLLDECANEGVYCSVCHKKVYKTDYANQKVKSAYCPNCGARMDGGDSECPEKQDRV